MRSFLGPILLMLGVLLTGCAPTQQPTPQSKVYLPKKLAEKVDSPLVDAYPSQRTPSILLDRIQHIGAAYLDLISVSRSAELVAQLPAPATSLGIDHGELQLVGQASFDWPIVVHRKEHSPQTVHQTLSQTKVRLLGQDGERLQLYLPTQNELTLVRLVEQWRKWSTGETPTLDEDALTALTYKPVAEAVAEADISLLMRSQWETIQEQGKANVVSYEHLVELETKDPILVAPWGLVTNKPSPRLSELAARIPQTPTPPSGARLSEVSYATATLLAHDLFPKRYGRQSQVGESWPR